MKRFLLSLVALVITSVCFAQNDNSNRDIVTKETATQFSNDQALLDMYKNRNKKIVTPEMRYKKGKRLKKAGYVIGGTFVAAGIVAILYGASMDKYDGEDLWSSGNVITHRKSYNYSKTVCFQAGSVLVAGGSVIGLPLILRGSALQRKSREQIHAASVINHDIDFKNGSSLNLGVDVLSDNLTFIKTPGLGVRYNF